MNPSAEKAIFPGLFAISAITMLERLAFFLTLSVILSYLQEEHALSITEADQVYSTFWGLLIFSPLFLGWLADFTNRRCVIASGLLALLVGYIMLSLIPADYNHKGYFPLIAIALGYGAFRPNMPVILGKLFDNNHMHHRGYIGFIVFHIFINMGALPAPFMAQFLKSSMGYEAVFLASACIVFIAYLLFLLTRKYQEHIHLKTDVLNVKTERSSHDHLFNEVVLVCLLLVIIPINMALYQSDTALTFFIRDFPGQLDLMGTTIKSVRLFIVLGFSLVLAGVFYTLFRYSRFLLVQIISIGLVSTALGYAVLRMGLQLYGTTEPLSVLYVAVILMSLGEALFAPLVIYTVYRTSPRHLKGLFMGLLGFLEAIASQLVMVTTGVYEKLGALVTFTIIGGLMAGLGILFFALQLVLKYTYRRHHPEENS